MNDKEHRNYIKQNHRSAYLIKVQSDEMTKTAIFLCRAGGGN